MEFLPLLAEYTIKPIGRQLGYVVHCRTNLQNLQNKVEELKATRQTIEDRIAEATRKGEEIQPDVSLWLTRVAEITAQTDELLNDESQAKLKCLNGCCPNLTARHQISRKSTKLVKDVEDYGKKEFPQVSCATRRKEVLDVIDKDYQDFESRMSVVKKIMDSLKESVIQRVGVFGIGGVGKTTLAEEVYRQASKDKKLFDDVVIVFDVKSNPDPETVQKKIVEKLGMDIRQTETIEGRASRLCARIQDKKILIILDDVQEKIKLKDLGVPSLPACKVLLTCRTKEVLLSHNMNADRMFQLDLLDKEETWSLFENKAGEVVKHNGLIRSLAIQVAEKCGGLPLLVITVASVLKENENTHIWKNALRQLKGFDKEDSTETAYLTLEWSYDRLGSTELQQLFLLCGFIVRESHIVVADLLKYGLCLGQFTNTKTVEDAYGRLEALLARLKDFCLLLDGETDYRGRRRVRMHDLVCLVANRIARRGEQVLSTEYRGDLKEWPDSGFLRKWTKFSLILRGINNLPELSLECPEVELFCLEGEYSRAEVNIPSNFLSEMQKLKVLVFTDMRMPSLPLSSQYLKTLQTLCLDLCTLGDITLLGQLSSLEVLSLVGSDLAELPREIAELTHLRLLDLSDCSELKVIPPTVISSLVRLEELKMRNSFSNWEMEGARAKSNASLSELKHLSRLSALEVCIPKVNFLPANLFSDKLTRYNIWIGDVGSEEMNETTLNTLELELTINNNIELDEGLKSLLKRTEDLSLYEGATSIVQQLDPKYYENLKHLQLLRNNFESTYIINTKVVWPNLVTLKVHGCHKSRFLFSSSTSRSLVRLEQLEISGCGLLQQIVSSTGECSEGNTDNMFPKLKVLELNVLPNLARFCRGNYIEFPALETLKIDECAKLVEFIGDKVATCGKDTRTRKEIEQRVLEEEQNHDVKGKNILFDGKVRFPHLTTLRINSAEELKAIWDVQHSRVDSFRRLKQVQVWYCDNLTSLFPAYRPSLVGRLTALETLEIRCCGSLEVIFELCGRSDVEEIHVDTAAPHDRLKSFDCQNLDSIDIEACRSLKQVFPTSVARGLQNLTRLKIWNCDGIEEIVGEEEEKEGLETIPPHFIFPKVTEVELDLLPQLSSFYPKPHVSCWPLLEQLKVWECHKVRTLAAEFTVSEKKKNEGNHLTSQSTLFSINYKVGFPHLTRLSIRSAKELKAIWDVQHSRDDTVAPHDQLKSFNCQNLASIDISYCYSLKQVFPTSVARGLQNLTLLRVRNCKAIDEIVGEEEEKEDLEDIPPHFIFPKVTEVELYDLPQLSSFYPKTHVSSWPLLEQLDVRGCDKVRTLFTVSEKKHETNHLTSPSRLFLINYKDSFPSLENLDISEMEIWNGPTQAIQTVFGKLKSITFRGDNWAPFSNQASFLFLQRLQNLEEIVVFSNDCLEIFVDEGISSSSGPGEEIFLDQVISGALPRVRTLKLSNMYQLMHLGNDDSSRSPLFPNLEILELFDCGRLKSIESSSAISFRNLTSLSVFGCDGLEYLTSYSVAKSLVQLKTLTVNGCQSLVVIVLGNGDDAAAGGNDIYFSRLHRLQLTHLYRLRRFYSGNCTLKFPSSMTKTVDRCPKLKLKISSDGVLQTETEDQKEDVEWVQTNPEISSDESATT